jgi:toxoflavin biosynthesis protein ToxD
MSGRKSRLIPFVIAITFCGCLAVTLGFGAWYVFGKNPASIASKAPTVISEPALTDAKAANPPATENTDSSKTTPAKSPPTDTVDVPSGVIEVGGSDPATPAKKIAVDSFFIAETEVTNQQFLDFIKETSHKAPVAWKDGEFGAGTANEPVTGITWQDSVDYCVWLSTKLKMTVRLPTEAEWELAARGPQGLKYPWGNEWDDRAAPSEEKNGFVHVVKSYPSGRSYVGAYDMAGNVWEWVSDEVESAGSGDSAKDMTKRIIKGGAANEQREFISATSRNVIPHDHSSRFLGFRYVIAKN